MVNVPKAFPKEFRRDVVAVARKGEAPINRIARDFGISESCLQRRLKIADEDGVKPGVTQADAAELREAKKRIKLLEQENGILRRAAAYLSQASLPK
jgi:transposase-like protein